MQIDVMDCASDTFYNFFKSTSSQNTRIYDEVFKCFPSDNILNFDDLKTYKDRDCLIKTNPIRVRFYIVTLLIIQVV
jgi:phospholipase D1/2